MWGTASEKTAFARLYPLFFGQSEDRSYAKGIKTIKALAECGYVPAIFQLGLAYFDHLGVRRSYTESFHHYLLAADAGYPSAECGVGNFYAIVTPKHDACEHDPESAAAWWLRASEHGNPGAQCNLAGCYLSGTGVPERPSEAYIWGTLAAHCSTIRFRSAEVFRDQALALLTESEIAQASARIDKLKQTLPFEWSEHMTYWRSLYQKYT